MKTSGILILIYGIININASDVGKTSIFHAPLDGSNEISMNWLVDYAKGYVQFEIKFPNNGKAEWFAFGFSDYGDYGPADYCVFSTNWKYQISLTDTHTNASGVLRVDEQQNCRNFDYKIKNNITIFTFTRLIDTCEKDDYKIEDGTTHIVWAIGEGPLFQLQGLNILTSSYKKGMIRVQLLKNLNTHTRLPPGTHVVDILADSVHVPPAETTYWCHVFELPKFLRQKHHVIRFQPLIEPKSVGLVHHMEVFHCEVEPNVVVPLYRGSCFDNTTRPEITNNCKKVIAAWAMGAAAFDYPEEVGYPIGGVDFNLFVMLEVHYNNVERRADRIDSSGMRLSIAPTLRKFDAGIMELGLEYIDKMAIPSGRNDFRLSGYCISECTAVSIPPSGIFVFGSQLHTHLTGTKVYTRHVRDGKELPYLNFDNHYSTHFQEIRLLKRLVHVLPGDALITTCHYKTDTRKTITLGGFSISDEMCVNYIHYYPTIKLEVCKSSISDASLQKYFKFLNKFENQPTSDTKGISENYGSIEWTPLRAEMLATLYEASPLSMQCNMSGGARFPGDWSKVPLTKVPQPLPAEKSCSD